MLSLRRAGSWSRVTRSRAQLLGPCFKTGRSECREPRSQVPAHARRRARRPTGRATPNCRQFDTAARHGLRRRAARPRPSVRQALLTRAADRRTRPVTPPASRRPPCRGASDGGAGGRCAPTPTSAPRDRSSGAERRRRTRPVPTVCLQTVSRTLELSFQSSLQLSLTVLVCYRCATRYLALAGAYLPLRAALSSNPTPR